MFQNFNYGLSPTFFMWEKTSTDITNSPDENNQPFNVTDINDPNNSDISYKNYSIFSFDAVPSEGHTAQSVVTKFPMSNGFVVSDHMIKQNRILKLKVVSANMVNNRLWEATLSGAILAAGDVVGMPIIGLIGNAVALVQTSFESQDRVKNAYKLFNEFMSKGTRLYVNTILGAYANCVVTAIETIQDKDTSTIMAAEIILEELQIANPSLKDTSVRTILENETDYSKFIKMGASIGLFELNRVLGNL